MIFIPPSSGLDVNFSFLFLFELLSNFYLISFHKVLLLPLCHLSPTHQTRRGPTRQRVPVGPGPMLLPDQWARLGGDLGPLLRQTNCKGSRGVGLLPGIVITTSSSFSTSFYSPALQAGTSAALLPDRTALIGTPGPHTWRGTVFAVSTSDVSIPNASIFRPKFKIFQGTFPSFSPLTTHYICLHQGPHIHNSTPQSNPSLCQAVRN